MRTGMKQWNLKMLRIVSNPLQHHIPSDHTATAITTIVIVVLRNCIYSLFVPPLIKQVLSFYSLAVSCHTDSLPPSRGKKQLQDVSVI